MNSMMISLIGVAVLGSGLAILFLFGEHGRWTMFAFLTLFVLSGTMITVWGIHLMVTGVMYQTWRGPVAGWQLLLVGGGLIIWFGWWLVKEWRKIRKNSGG